MRNYNMAFQLFTGKNKKDGKEVMTEAQKIALFQSARMTRIIMRMKCKTPECKEKRRDGSAWCQVCSDKHKFEQKKFQANLKKG